MSNSTSRAPRGSNGSSSHQQEAITSRAKYFRLDKAATMLGCTADELLHLGAIGQAELLGPVVSPATFIWPDGGPGMFFPEIEAPFKVQFNEVDRVIFAATDLARIEAVGWCIPSMLFAPEKARELVSSLAMTLEGAIAREHDLQRERREVLMERKDAIARWAEENRIPWEQLEKMLVTEPLVIDDGFQRMREQGFDYAWFLVDDPQDDAPKTTLAHLFITKDELTRLGNGDPQSAAALARQGQTPVSLTKEHGNAERFSKPRIVVLQAAIHCLAEQVPRWPNATELARMIDTKGPSFWPENGSPPLSLSVIEELLREVLRLPFQSLPYSHTPRARSRQPD